MPIFSLLFFKNEKFQQANSTVSRVCYKYCIPLQNFRKILVNCLKEKLKTLLHMIVFLKHDQLIQTEGLIENFMHALNFANCYVESRQCQTLYDTCTYPIMHLIPPTTPPAQICMTFVFHFSWVSQPSQGKLKTMLTQNFGANKVLRLVHYGWCASGEFMCRYVQTLS